MEVKAVGAVLLLLGCTAMGIGKMGKLYLREKRLRDLQELLQALRTEILYRQTPLEQAMTGSALCIEGGGKAFCQLFQSRLELFCWEGFDRRWEECCDVFFSDDVSRYRDREVWLRLGRQLGHGGLSQQEAALDHCDFQLQGLEQEAAEERKSRGRMYVTVGICCGVFLNVLLL